MTSLPLRPFSSAIASTVGTTAAPICEWLTCSQSSCRMQWEATEFASTASTARSFSPVIHTRARPLAPIAVAALAATLPFACP